jgi:hypothetical protein
MVGEMVATTADEWVETMVRLPVGNWVASLAVLMAASSAAN